MNPGEVVTTPRGKARVERIDDRTFSIPFCLCTLIEGRHKGEKLAVPVGTVIARKTPIRTR